MAQKTSSKLLLLTTLYLSQGLPFGFFVQALPVFMREAGVSLKTIGLTSLLSIPWALKFLLGPWFDRSGRRRTIILFCQAFAVVLMAAMAMSSPDQLPFVLTMVALINLCSASQDVATDGFAVLLLDEDERGWGNGIQVAGYRVGMIIGGGLILVLYGYLGWSGSLLSIAALLAAASIPLWLRAEVPPSPAPATSASKLIHFLPTGATSWLLLVATFKVGDYLVGGMLKPWLVDAGLEKADIGWIFGFGGFISGLLGAVAGGWWLGWFGRLRGLIVFSVLQALGNASYALAAAFGANPTYVWAAVLFEHFVGGLATVALFTWMMDVSRPAHASFDYSFQASLVVMASIAGSAVSGVVAESVGYEATFWLGAGYGLLWCVMAAVMLRRGRQSASAYGQSE